MLTRVALVTQQKSGLEEIRYQLRHPLKYTLREFHSLEEVNKGLVAFKPSVLIVRIPHFGLEQLDRMQKMKTRFSHAGLVTMASKIDPQGRYGARQVVGHKLLEDPLEVKDLASVVDKLSQGDPSRLRLHPRVKRTGEAEIHEPVTGLTYKASFLDFAQMGARLSLQGKYRLPRDGKVQLHYRSSSEPGRVHRIEARIMWECGVNAVEALVSGQSQVVGLRFIAAL